MVKILLMDDDEAFASVLSELLAANGHSVRCCSTASDAIELISKTRFDLLITDIIVRHDNKTVPDGGISLISRLRGALSWNLEPWMKEMPIIAISGAIHNQGLSDLLRITKDLGADMALGKPTDTGELLDAIHLLTRKPKNSPQG
ncbi:response regulator [uncultured Roseobacter sp.]|uniref:response regulator transcription factor n=1 Tax=uncultured Roseobacter sp. TaxID=114847 RepID=UPI00260480E2|nr:response regulator [uncultured Roseobacter sp.]